MLFSIHSVKTCLCVGVCACACMCLHVCVCAYMCVYVYMLCVESFLMYAFVCMDVDLHVCELPWEISKSCILIVRQSCCKCINSIMLLWKQSYYNNIATRVVIVLACEKFLKMCVDFQKNIFYMVKPLIEALNSFIWTLSVRLLNQLMTVHLECFGTMYSLLEYLNGFYI